MALIIASRIAAKTGMANAINANLTINRSTGEAEWAFPPGFSIPECIALFKQRFEQ